MKKNNFLFIFTLLLISITSESKTIRYVKIDGTGDGTSWANASNSIQTMIDNSASTDEVWVAKGTYYPTAETIPRDPRSMSFFIKEGVSLRGGFSGYEKNLSQRLLTDTDCNGQVDSSEFVNKTILSGNIDGVDDVWTKSIITDGKVNWTLTGNEGNCYRVVTGENENLIDGFFIEGGNANGSGVVNGGGVFMVNFITNCHIYNCSTTGYGGGVYIAYSITNCHISNCSSSNGSGGGIYLFKSISNSYITNCSAQYGGGVSAPTNISNKVTITNCNIYNCSASYGGGVCYFSNSSTSNDGLSIINCNILNCTGDFYIIYGSKGFNLTNCNISNCYSGYGLLYSYSDFSIVNCSFSNNKIGSTIGSGIINGTQTSFISPSITAVFIQPTSFIGVATTEAQELELKNANWRLKEGSPCINAGTSINVSIDILTGKDLDNNPRVAYGAIDIGAYEYIIQKINLPVVENFNNLSDLNSSNSFYNSAQLNSGQDTKWSITNQKAQFSWQTNLTSTYSQPLLTYQIDATNAAKVYLRYDMFYQAYAGTISPLGTEKLNIEYSTDLLTWSNIATYTNANGTIANQKYKHDLTSKLAGKTFFIRFNANGQNSNRIEKWEIDNVIIDADGVSAVNTIHEYKYKYTVGNNGLIISNLENGDRIELFDTNGKLLNTKSAESQNAQLTLPVRGVNLVKVSSDSGVENKKVVW